jgi:tRNA G18 (ribose-2'-O)-methylase SpoU
MPLVEIGDLHDPRLIPFRNLRNHNWTHGSGWFIAEGPLLVERLLASDYPVQALLVSRKRLDRYVDRVPAATEVLVVDEEQVAEIVGFHFHRGVMGCGVRQPRRAVRDGLPPELAPDETLVGVQGVQDPENLGGILRSCAALGIRRVLVGPNSADPLSRRVLRVSMGTALSLDLLTTRDLIGDLAWLKQQYGVESVATTLADDSRALESATRHGPILILMGNEAHGLPLELQQAADRRIKIDMRLGTDSLNVSVAAGIILHYFCRVAARGPENSVSES